MGRPPARIRLDNRDDTLKSGIFRRAVDYDDVAERYVTATRKDTDVSTSHLVRICYRGYMKACDWGLGILKRLSPRVLE